MEVFGAMLMRQQSEFCTVIGTITAYKTPAVFVLVLEIIAYSNRHYSRKYRFISFVYVKDE